MHEKFCLVLLIFVFIYKITEDSNLVKT